MQIFGDNWEEVIHKKGSSKAGGRRWNGIEETKKRWQRLATVAIRRLRRRRERALGNAPAVIYLAGCYGVFALEELLGLLGTPAWESLLPVVHKSSSPNAPT